MCIRVAGCVAVFVEHVGEVVAAMQNMMQHTCVVFRPRDASDTVWIRIEADPNSG